jgi:hypothetical protein
MEGRSNDGRKGWRAERGRGEEKRGGGGGGRRKKEEEEEEEEELEELEF